MEPPSAAAARRSRAAQLGRSHDSRRSASSTAKRRSPSAPRSAQFALQHRRPDIFRRRRSGRPIHGELRHQPHRLSRHPRHDVEHRPRLRRRRRSNRHRVRRPRGHSKQRFLTRFSRPKHSEPFTMPVSCAVCGAEFPSEKGFRRRPVGKGRFERLCPGCGDRQAESTFHFAVLCFLGMMILGSVLFHTTPLGSVLRPKKGTSLVLANYTTHNQ